MATPLKPAKGMGVTQRVGSDRYPYTILDVAPNGKQIRIQADDSKPGPGHEYYGTQVWVFSPDTNGEKKTISLRKDGRWREVGSGRGGSTYGIGVRDKYLDPSF